MINEEDKIKFKKFLQEVGLEKIDFYQKTRFGQYMSVFEFLKSFEYFLKREQEASNDSTQTHSPL